MDAAEQQQPPRMRQAVRAVPPRLAGVKVPGLAIATLLLLVFAVLSLAPALSTYLNQRQQLADATAKVAGQERDIARLDAEKARWSDPAYIRSQAGSRLFYVLPGEVTYRVVGSSAEGGTAPAPTRTAQATKTDWTSVLLGSVLGAGTTDATPGG